MKNELNLDHQAKERALKVLRETEKYVNGVNEDGKKILYFLIEQVRDALREINRAIGEMDSRLPQYGDTDARNKMLELRSALEERERFFRAIEDKRGGKNNMMKFIVSVF